MARIKGGTSSANLRGRIQRLNDGIDREELLQELNPEDHPVQHATSEAEIKRSEERVRKKQAEIKALKRKLAKSNTKKSKTLLSRGGGGGGVYEIGKAAMRRAAAKNFGKPLM